MVLTKEEKRVDSVGRIMNVSLNSSEALQSLWLRRPSMDWQLLFPVPDTITVDARGEGTRVLLLKGVDAAGNTQPSASNFTWFVPLSCAVILPGGHRNSSGPTPFFTRYSTVRFTLNGSMSVYSYLVSIDNTTFEPVRGSVYVGNTSGDGVHSLRVRGVDVTGAADTSVCSTVFWLVDTTPPVGSNEKHFSIIILIFHFSRL